MNNAQKVLNRLEEHAVRQSLPSIGPVKGKILEELIQKYKPKMILEIGTLYGYSAILMARLLPKCGKVITVEIDKDAANIARRNIEDANLLDKIEIITGGAREIIPILSEKADLLFLDATKKEYFEYLKLAERNLRSGSVVVADNAGAFKEEMQDYLDYVRKSEYKSRTIKVPPEFRGDVEDAMEVSVKI